MDFLEDLLDIEGRNHKKHSIEDNGYPSNHDFCPKCSAPIVQGARYCQRCGASLTGLDGRNRMRRNSKRRRLVTIVLIGLSVVTIILVGLVILAVIYAVKNHTQILNEFSKIIHYIFGDSLNNVIKNLVNQSIDNFLRNLFNSND